ncbi:hypothetical protein C8D96_0642 [Kushneria marisflavi]|nr:hypothetical protein C8D96_0642 [Kushneria marisflavi]
MNPVSPVGADMVASATTTRAQSSQNLFEHMASQASASHQTSPSELGANLLDNLDGFFNRVSSFSQETGADSVQASEPMAQVTTPENGLPVNDGGDTPSVLDNEAMAKVVDSLGRVFDHSIETSMVVRGATQVSGSANTLLKGQ